MKLYPKKGKYTTGYFAFIGSKEARDAGFISDDGTTKELVKVVDPEKRTITIMLPKDE